MVQVAMRFLIAVVTSHSFVALQLAESKHRTTQREEPEDPACNHKSPNISVDYDGPIMFRYFYNSILGICVDDFVPTNYTKGFETFHNCVSKCRTGQAASHCAEAPKFACGNDTEGCYEAFYYNISSRQCVKHQALIQYTPNDTNDFFTEWGCNYSCMGFTMDDVDGNQKA